MEGKDWVWTHGGLLEADLVEMKERINTRIRKKQALEQNIEFAKFLKML